MTPRTRYAELLLALIPVLVGGMLLAAFVRILYDLTIR